MLHAGGALHGLLDATVEALLLSQAQLLAGRGQAAHWAEVYTKAGGDLQALTVRIH